MIERHARSGCLEPADLQTAAEWLCLQLVAIGAAGQGMGKLCLLTEEIAAVSTFIRQSWGNAASPVSTLDVLRVK